MKEFKVIKEMIPTLSLEFNKLTLFFKLVGRIINEYRDVILDRYDKDYLNVRGLVGFKKNEENQELSVELVISYDIIRASGIYEDISTSCYNVTIPLEYLTNEKLLKEKRRIIKEEKRKRKEIEKKNKELDEKYGYSKWKSIDDALTTTDVIEGFADTIEDAKRALYEEINKED